MSFSKKVKDELFDRFPTARHCMLAELAAVTLNCGEVEFGGDGVRRLTVCMENGALARKYFELLEKIFNIENVRIEARKFHARTKGDGYCIVLDQDSGVRRVCEAIKLERLGMGTADFTVNPIIVQNTCCKRAFLRGSFLAGGSLSDPEKAYHFEIVFPAVQKAERMREIMHSFSVEAKVIRRKKYFVLYVKEGSQIVELLNIMEAHLALMELENVRILKDVRNSVNRQVNCEAANINKTVQAAARQIDDIIYIRDSIGFDRLADGLREVAELRVEYPEASLKELGEMMDTPLGKSGVNHRLKRLCGIAEDMRRTAKGADSAGGGTL